MALGNFPKEPGAAAGRGCSYELIALHFLATVSPDCKFLRRKVSFDLGGEGFSADSAVVGSDAAVAKIVQELLGRDAAQQLLLRRLGSDRN